MPDPLGRACLFPLSGKEKFVTVVDVCVVRLSEETVSNRYITYLINSGAIRQQIESFESGTTRKRISGKNLARVRLPIPPLSEQRRIVGKVEELFSELDEGVANLKQARAQLAVYRQALLKHAFEGDFPITKIGSACSIQSGNGFPLEFQGRSQGELGFFKVGDISRNWQAKRIMLAHAEHYISKSEADSLKAKTLQAGSVVFAKIGAAVALNRRAILEVDSLVDNNVMGLIPGENLSSRFLFYFMCQIDLGAKTRGGNVPSLRRGDLEEIDMPLPSQSEQDDIVASLEQQLSVVTALQSDIDVNLQKAEALRQSILKKAFAGELVSQDPADEPAAALLARIRAEREAQAAKSAKKKPATPRRAKA
jgi:type I restriction enzyme S subunit